VQRTPRTEGIPPGTAGVPARFSPPAAAAQTILSTAWKLNPEYFRNGHLPLLPVGDGRSAPSHPQ
ncbi:MAG: hypothetical protein OSA48_04055, partial [Akkermansiaceae bacterium]|nr:hypothetical protein [Akkermansiaceae bacterium]